jgi:hypothetical protein
MLNNAAERKLHTIIQGKRDKLVNLCTYRVHLAEPCHKFAWRGMLWHFMAAHGVAWHSSLSSAQRDMA